MDVSVVVVNWNTRDLLRRCLASIPSGIGTNHRFETWVVDNHSSDDSTAMIAAEFPGVRLIANPENVGFARANNQALRQASGRHLLLLNSDCEVLPEAISAMVDFLDAHPQAGAVGCRLLNGDRSIQRSAWKSFPTLSSLVASAFRLEKFLLLRAKLTHEERSLASASAPVSVAHLLGACLMVRHAASDQVGLMDEQYFMYLEETDWCRRLGTDGWSVWYLPSHQIIHFGQQSAALAPDKAMADWCRSMCRFYRAAYTPSFLRMTALKTVIALRVVLDFAVKKIFPGGKSRTSWSGVRDALQALRAA